MNATDEEHIKKIEKRNKKYVQATKMLAFVGDIHAKALLSLNNLFDKQHIILAHISDRKTDKETTKRIINFCDEIEKLFIEFMKQENIEGD